MNCHFQLIIVVTGRQWQSSQSKIMACKCWHHVRMHETARRRRIVSRDGRSFWHPHAHDTFTQTTQRNCNHRHSSSTKRTRSCALQCKYKTQRHACTQSSLTTALKDMTAQLDGANTSVLLLSSHLRLHSAILMPAAAVARQAAACPMNQSVARQDQQHSAACCFAPAAAATEAAVDWSFWTAAVPVVAQLVWRMQQQHCWRLQHWRVALLADPCPCPAET